MQNPRPERLILKIPRRLWIRKTLAFTFCMAQGRAVLYFLALMVFGSFIVILAYFGAAFAAIVSMAILWVALLIGCFACAYGVIVIRKDCFECQFAFHVIAHERAHLLLRASDEIVVEEEALKKTEDRLIPILLSNPEMCRGCLFMWRKMYCQATSNYLKEYRK